jgi:hypothetical protein
VAGPEQRRGPNLRGRNHRRSDRTEAANAYIIRTWNILIRFRDEVLGTEKAGVCG